MPRVVNADRHPQPRTISFKLNVQVCLLVHVARNIYSKVTAFVITLTDHEQRKKATWSDFYKGGSAGASVENVSAPIILVGLAKNQ